MPLRLVDMVESSRAAASILVFARVVTKRRAAQSEQGRLHLGTLILNTLCSHVHFLIQIESICTSCVASRKKILSYLSSLAKPVQTMIIART